MAQFSDILDRAPSEIEKPKPLPVGTYICVVDGLPEHGESSKKKTPYVRFKLKFLSAEDDVDQDELAAWAKKGDGSSRSLGDARLNNDYYITEDAIWRLKDFLSHLGIEEQDSLRQMIESAPGSQVKVFLRHEASEDGQSVFARVGNTAAVD